MRNSSISGGMSVTGGYTMSRKNPEQYTSDDVIRLFGRFVDVVVVVDKTTEKYRAVIRRGMFETLIESLQIGQ